MRWMLLVGALATVVVIAVATSGVTQVVSNSTHPALSAGFLRMGCNASIGPWNAGGGDKGRYDASRLNDEQRNIVARIISIGQERKLPPLAWQVAIQAGMMASIQYTPAQLCHRRCVISVHAAPLHNGKYRRLRAPATIASWSAARSTSFEVRRFPVGNAGTNLVDRLWQIRRHRAGPSVPF